jgi:HD-GYP domain-containing protein (c-di-GMP phosphodiesterase class II)/pSer/pThr/pTyr-binding forkhead associated (FHA) protein
LDALRYLHAQYCSPMHLAIQGTGRLVPLTEAVVLTAGRVAQCDIHLDDQAVSRRHCTFELRDGRLVVIDLESANGTYVNEHPVQRAELAVGDVVRIGSTRIDVRGDAEVMPSRQRVPATVMGDTGPMESVIRKRFDPATFEWLTAATTAPGADLAVLQRAARHLTTLHRVSEVLATARDLRGLSEATLAAILEVTDADRVALVLRRADPATGGAEVAAARARDGDGREFTVSRTLVADVLEKGVSTFAHDASADARFSTGRSVVQQRIRSVMCVPLRTADDILGALYVDSLSGPGRFAEPDLELLAAIGNHAGVALHRVRLLSELERLLLDTIRAIAATIDAKDGYTHRHSERVAALSRRLGAALGLPPEELQTVELSALLHDVGKIAVPDSILNKPGSLTPEEFAEMRKHPVHGARILANIQSPAIQAVLPGVQYHHERWDGSGYPDGLEGEAIPLLGRLLGIADFFDAMTSARAYRAPLPVTDAVRLIAEGAGTHFDPRIVAVLVDLHARHSLVPSE